MADSEKRSYTGTGAATGAPRQWVGGRQHGGAAPAGGGGYRDICTDPEILKKNAADPRIDDLVAAGLNPKWRALAQRLGYDAFMVAWDYLSQIAEDSDDGHRVYVPKFDILMRYRRNQYIKTLNQANMRHGEIAVRVARDLGERVSVQNVSKIIRS